MTATPETTTMPVTLSPSAAVKILEVMRQQEGLTAAEQNLRLFVEGGGCGGPAFGLVFDKAEKDDVRYDCEGVSIVVDPLSLPYLQGASVDYVETPEVTGFKVTAPNAAAMGGGGGCGSGGCGSGGGGGGGCGTDAHDHAGHDHGAAKSGGGGCGSGGCC
jgi:iron-sulfur cluster assembly accessory protein